jgi:hypothetical protein
MNDDGQWLESELVRQLAPVAAPGTLWDRVCTPRPSVPRGTSIHRVAWPVAAAIVLVAGAGAFWQLNRMREPVVELPATSRDFDFRSNDFGAVRTWVKAKADIDIDLPDESAVAENAPARVLGVRLIRFRGLPSAAIDYRVGDGSATLVVSRKRAGLRDDGEAGKHLFSAMKASGNERLISWSMRDQNYTIAFSGEKDLRGACVLCHANQRGMVTAN